MAEVTMISPAGSDTEDNEITPTFSANAVTDSALTGSTEALPDSEKENSINVQKECSNIFDWPTASTAPKKGPLLETFNTLYDLVSLIIPFIFFALAFAAAVLDKRVVEDNLWILITHLKNVAVTVFPIIFSGIIRDTNKTIAAWKLERGTSLGLQEQLLGSTSLFGALKTQFLLKTFNLVSFVLVAMAIIAPLGGQGYLRLLDTETYPKEFTTDKIYLDVERGTSIFDYGADYLLNLPTLNAIYITSLITPQKNKTSSMDIWGNIKVPYLPPANDSSQDFSTWRDVPQDTSYSSLLGIPLIGLNFTTNSSFTMNSSYLDLNCFNNTTMNSSIAIDGNGTTYRGNATGPFSIAISGFTQNNGVEPTVWDFINAISSPLPQTLLFQSNFFNDSGYENFVAYCTITTKYVESVVKCSSTSSSCAVTSMRSLQSQHPSESLTALGFQSVFQRFSSSLTGITDADLGPGVSSLMECYLQNPENPIAIFEDGNQLNLQNIARSDFEQRLGQVINTYYIGSLCPPAFVGDWTNESVPNMTTVVTLSQDITIYTCKWVWWAVLVIANTIMLVAAILGAVLKRRIIGPDILGYVSSLTRDSPYIDLPPGGTMLDGMERAKLLKKLRIRLGDVESGKGNGHVALATVQSGVGRLEKGRKYA